jgi:ubiquinone/menaquinone biosynthesis C-methylase UbiE
MNKLETDVIAQYQDGALLARILDALKDSGIDIDNLQPHDLAPIDEFHIGGRKATQHLLDKMALAPHAHVLDVGCGIGGAARHIATSGNRVTGIDLTPEYIETAKALSHRTGSGELLHFEVANALSMPFENATFDAAITLHAAMNISDRLSLYAEMARLVKSSGVLGVYDVMMKKDSDLNFPLPWSDTPETSHLVTPEKTADLLRDAGFDVYEVEDRTNFAIEFFKQALAAIGPKPPPIGIHLLMGDNTRSKLRNISDHIINGQIAPVQILAKRN